MGAKVVALVRVFFFAYFSPNLGDKVLSLTDIDFDDKVFGSSSHFVVSLATRFISLPSHLGVVLSILYTTAGWVLL